MPGDDLGTSEEYLTGEGTYDDDGIIRASMVGHLRINTADMEVRVEPINPPRQLQVGDRVLGSVTRVSENMAMVEIAGAEGVERDFSGRRTGALHISKATAAFIRDMTREFKTGDLLRAKVAQVKPSLQLSTSAPDTGVVMAYCGRCREPLVRTDRGLYCGLSLIHI